MPGVVSFLGAQSTWLSWALATWVPMSGGPALIVTLITPMPASRKPALHGVQEFQAYLSEKAPHFSAPHCVLFCRVCAVSLLVSEVEVSDCISAPTARRLRVENAGLAPSGRRQRRIADWTSAA